MTTYLNNYTSSIYETDYDDQYNGVVRVSNGSSYGTGTLLYDGRSILTAAHIFEGEDTDNITVYFDTRRGTIEYSATVTVYENYDSENSNGDLAILTLEENPSSFYQRYDIYRDGLEIGNDFTMVGYGSYGSGRTGELNRNDILKLTTENTFEADFYDIDEVFDTNLAWDPLEDTILVADFDNGYSSNDALGVILGINDTGVGNMEGMIASGDSGGPAFIDDMVAGIASYSSSISTGDVNTDINNSLDSSFGELGAWQRVSYYQEWIDKTIRENYEDVPTTSDEVETTFLEQDDGVFYTYFLLEFLGNRESITENITLNYTTRDGTATQGEDYIFTEGIITLYGDESSVIIPVEIIADTISEDDEIFYLDVSDPSYGTLGDETTLTASRTILNDDYLIG